MKILRFVIKLGRTCIKNFILTKPKRWREPTSAKFFPHRIIKRAVEFLAVRDKPNSHFSR